MASTVTLEEVKKAIFFPFKGEKWGIKLLIGSMIMVAVYIPVAGIAAIIALDGYFGQIMKRVIVQDEDPELPEWKDWGTLFLDGLKILGTSLIYTLPGMLCVVAGYALFMVLDFAFAFSTASINPHATTLPLAFFGNLFGMFGGMALIWVGMLLMMVGAVFLPPALGNMIAKENFGAAFRIKEWWPVFKVNIGGYLLTIAMMMGIYSLMILVIFCLYFTVILCILIPIAVCVAIFLLGVMVFTLYAVSYRDGVRKLAEKG